MKNIIPTLSIALAAILLFPSCKKEKEEADNSITKVEYKITPFNTFFNSVEWTLPDERTVLWLDPQMGMRGGVSSVDITSKPFPAMLKVEASNPTTTAYNYVLSIWVNGQMKASEAVVLPGSAVKQVNEVAFSVQ